MPMSAGAAIPANLSELRESLMRTAACIARTRHDAEDLVQTALARYLEHRDRLRPDTVPMAWLSRVLRNLAIDEHRRAALGHLFRDQLRNASRPQTHEPDAWAELQISDVHDALRLCPEPLQSAFRMFHLEGLSLRRISERTTAPVATVAVRVHRARRRLRRILSHRNPTSHATTD